MRSGSTAAMSRIASAGVSRGHHHAWWHDGSADVVGAQREVWWRTATTHVPDPHAAYAAMTQAGRPHLHDGDLWPGARTRFRPGVHGGDEIVALAKAASSYARSTAASRGMRASLMSRYDSWAICWCSG